MMSTKIVDKTKVETVKEGIMMLFLFKSFTQSHFSTNRLRGCLL